MEGGNRDLVKLLLDDGMGINLHQEQKPDQQERVFTPLHLAARLGFSELIPLLLDDGYQVHALDQEGRTPLHCAALGTNLGWYETLHPETSCGPQRALLEQSGPGKEGLSRVQDPKLLDPSLYSALHYASGNASLK